MWCAHGILVLLLTLDWVAVSYQADNDICSIVYCVCTPAAHPSWTTVNCTVPDDQNLEVYEKLLPEHATDIIINRGKTIILEPNSLSKLKDPRRVQVTGAKHLLIRKHAAIGLNAISALLDISHCDDVQIESRAFSNIKGPITTSIHNCSYVAIDKEAFSWLLSLNINDVEKLSLGPGAFMLDAAAKRSNGDDHGPEMTIELKNLTVDEFPFETFGSSAAKILLDTVEVKTIRQEAFSANTYNVLMAINSTIHLMEGQAIAEKTLINNLQFHDCKIHQIKYKALQSAMTNLTIIHSSFDQIDEGAINVTVAAVLISKSNFSKIYKRGLELSSWNKLQVESNLFKNLEPFAFVAPSFSMVELIFIDNAIEKTHESSLGFIGEAYAKSNENVVYHKNYYAETCTCNITIWLASTLGVEDAEPFTDTSYCTVNEFFARCYNTPEQNIIIQKFYDEVCDKDSITCEPFKTKSDGTKTEIKNPIFPHKNQEEVDKLTHRNNKVIGIIIVSVLGAIIIAMLLSLIRWMRRRGYCLKIKDFMISSSYSSCPSFCDRFCGINGGLDNTRSISQLSVNEYSERHRLNEPRGQDMIQETTIPDMYTEEIIPMEDKTTQTLPEELTKELLESLREKLDDPENYVEAREMIEHLYELIKVEENCNNSPSPNLGNREENIYELPFINTTPRIGKNKQQMYSVGTRIPSLDKLSPLSPYNRQTSLSHEYFEPKDLAVHLYSEIANSDKDRKNLNAMPDLVGEQAVPRGPYLRAVREKLNGNNISPTSITNAKQPPNTSTMKSNKSTTSNSSAKMLNRPLPEKPTTFDPGEGTSVRHS